MNRLSNEKKKNRVPLLFRLGEEKQPFGAPLEIHLDQEAKEGTKLFVEIVYQTSPSASGLQWVAPEFTEGKKHWYLFSQFQPLHARSFVPIQDTPGAKVTYDARIRCPDELTPLMSAICIGQDASGAYLFHQRVPVSSYLIAIVVGHLACKRIGRISHVWTEPEKLDECAAEFDNVDQFIDAADRVTGLPYDQLGWGKFDLLVLPSSFPYGGMENPTLTFVTPTLLAGDKSLTNVIAHEVSFFFFFFFFFFFSSKLSRSSLPAGPLLVGKPRFVHHLGAFLA